MVIQEGGGGELRLSGESGHLLGLRGQGKTRLLRQLPSLLDEWTPMLAGTDLREDPFAPTTTAGSMPTLGLVDVVVPSIHAMP